MQNQSLENIPSSSIAKNESSSISSQSNGDFTGGVKFTMYI